MAWARLNTALKVVVLVAVDGAEVVGVSVVEAVAVDCSIKVILSYYLPTNGEKDNANGYERPPR